MEVCDFLDKMGKEVENNDISEKINELPCKYLLESEKISLLLIEYLCSKKNESQVLTMDIIDDFENETLMHGYAAKLAHKSPIKKKNKNILIENNFDILKQYQDEEYTHSYISSITTDQKSDINLMDCDVKENYITNNMWIVEVQDTNGHIYMYQKNTQLLEEFEKHSLALIKKRLENLNLKQDVSKRLHLEDMSAVDATNQEVYICGTIVIDHAHESNQKKDCDNNISNVLAPTKLSPDNIAIQGLSTVQMAVVSLNLEETSSYSFFPGQTVILKGQNSSKTGFIPSEILPNHIAPCKPIRLSEIADDLSVLIACGPFSLKEEQNGFLDELKMRIEQVRCHAVILIGPFLDINNDHVEKRSETEMYSHMLTETLRSTAKLCTTLNVHVVFVPSVNDIGLTEPVFPQPRFEFSNPVEELHNPYVHFATNPGFFSIGPYTFGASSIDILRHMSLQEITKKPSTTSIRRLCQHILEENNFYPVRPAHNEVSVDWTMWSKCHLGVQPPHCLILPSVLNRFKEDINGVCCINPGKVVTNSYKGSFCKVTLSAAQMSDGVTSVSQAINCEFIRL